MLLLAILCGALLGGLYWYRTRAGTSPAELVAYLPAGPATTLYIDVDATRRSGILNMVAGSKAAEEIEYKEFVDETLFDYRQDLDAIAVEFQGNQVFFALRGRFHWKNLTDYAVHHGGSCRNGYCVAPGSRPDRRVSFYALRPDTMALAVAPDDFGAYQIKRKSPSSPLVPPPQPVWAVVPVAALKSADALPAGAKPYVSALGNADEITLAIGPEGDHLQLALNVTCRDTQAAIALVRDLQAVTSTLRSWIDQEHKQPNPAELTGLLLAGSFRREDRKVYGEWPIPRAFVDALAAGGF